jgi:hypothetical protein
MIIASVRNKVAAKPVMIESYHVSHFLAEGAYLAVGAFIEGHGYVTMIYAALLVLHVVSPIFVSEA